MLRLPELQRAFFRGIVGSHDVREGEFAASDLAGEIRGHGALTGAERLAIYARMYCSRLIDALREDFPRVAGILGADQFAAVAHGYVAAHPSTHPSLRWLGVRFAEFLARETWPPDRAFLPDLASLEWSRRRVFDASDVALLDVDALRAVPPERWPTLHFRLIPAVAVLSTAWPVHRLWEADASEPRGGWRPEDTQLRVWRQDDRVFQAPMDVVERTAFASALAGRDFSGICDGLSTVVSVDEAATTAGGLVLRWIADGILRADAIVS